MATLNRGVAERAVTTVIEQEVDSLLESADTPPLQDLGLVDTQTGESRVLDLSWMRRYSMMREWVGERDMSTDRQLFSARMHNRKFEDTIRIELTDIEDDMGMLNPQGEAQGLVGSYQEKIKKEQYSYLHNAMNENFVNGTITGPYGEQIFEGSMDGEPLLSDSHPYFKQIEYDANAPRGQRLNIVDGGTFQNLVNTEFSEDALWTARQEMQELVDFRGNPASVAQPDTLIVPPALEREATQVLERSRKLDESGAGAAVDNETEGLFDVYVDRSLQGSVEGVDLTFGGVSYSDQTLNLDEMWFLVNRSAQMSPFVMWNRKPLELQRPVGTPDLSSDSPAAGEIDYTTFKEDAVVIGARARFGMSFGMPQAIYGSLGNQTLS